jgi:putative transposase
MSGIFPLFSFLTMKKSRFSEAQILGILRQQDQGLTVAQICRGHSLSEATFCTWKRQYGGMNVSELQRLKHLEDENRRLKQLVTDLSLENQVVKEVLRKK